MLSLFENNKTKLPLLSKIQKVFMHILLLTDGITPFVTGGMQRHSANLAKYFTLAGAKVSLVHCVENGKSQPSDQEVNESLFGGDPSQ